jgi:hypothetical protein
VVVLVEVRTMGLFSQGVPLLLMVKVGVTPTRTMVYREGDRIGVRARISMWWQERARSRGGGRPVAIVPGIGVSIGTYK